jgi:hypothetical protein
MRIAWLVFGLVSASASAFAEPAPAPENHAGVSVTGLLGLLRINVGSYALSYERRLADHHTVRVVGDFLHVHHASDQVQSHQWTFGGGAGYRYYLRSTGGGVFVGGELGYRRGFGHFGERGTPDHVALHNRQARVLGEVGARYLHPRRPLSFVVRVGAGYGPYTVTTDRMDELGRAAVQLSQDNLAVRGLVVEAELAIAWSF